MKQKNRKINETKLIKIRLMVKKTKKEEYGMKKMIAGITVSCIVLSRCILLVMVQDAVASVSFSE